MNENGINVEETVEGLINILGGEDKFIRTLIEVYDSHNKSMIAKKVAKDLPGQEVRELYVNAGTDGSNLMERNYNRGFKEIYN
mgnify:CR=1 FL=1